MKIEVRNLSKTFLGRGQPVFSGINMAFRKKSQIGLCNNYGSGLSTFLKILSGLEIPDYGEILWEGQSLTSLLTPEEGRQFLQYKVSYVFPHFLSHLMNPASSSFIDYSVEDILREEVSRCGNLSAKQQLVYLKVFFDIPNFFLKKPYHSLSVIKKLEVEMIKGLIKEPEIFIADHWDIFETSSQIRKMKPFFHHFVSYLKEKSILGIFVTNTKGFLEEFDEFFKFRRSSFYPIKKRRRLFFL